MIKVEATFMRKTSEQQYIISYSPLGRLFMGYTAQTGLNLSGNKELLPEKCALFPFVDC